MTVKLFGIGVGLLLLGGCSLDPHYIRPVAPVAPQFPTGASYTPVGEVPLVAWRDFFVDARLRAVIVQALANNRDIRIAIANIASARAQYRIERSYLLPTISATADASFGRSSTGGSTSGFGGTTGGSGGGPSSTGGSTSGVSGSTGGSGGANYDIYSVSVGVASYELDFFGRIRSLSRQALELYFATEQAQRSVQITLIAEVATAYLNLGSDRSLLKIAEQTVQSAGAAVDYNQKRLDAGIASGLDVEQARQVLEQARFDVARYTTLIAQDRNALELAVGAPVADALLLPGLAEEAVSAQALGGISSTRLLTRPDVLEAENNLRAANASIGAARAAFFPSITLTGSGGTISPSLNGLFGAGSGTWSFLPSINLPLFTGGLNRANLAFAKAQRELSVARYEQAIQIAFREVADALATRGTIDAQVTAQARLTDAARTTLVLSTARYEIGSDAYLTVLDAQRSFYAAQQTLTTTRLSRVTSLVTLYRTLGGGVGAQPES